MERDLGASLQLNDEKEERIAFLEKEIERLEREKAEVDRLAERKSVDLERTTKELENLSDELQRRMAETLAAEEERRVERERIGKICPRPR